MSATGFVNQAYCDMMSWPWYTDVPVRCLFEHLLRVVNKSDNVISGLSIKAGSVLTTIPYLSFTTGLTEKQIRISCQKLISTNDISISAFHKKGSIITIIEWDKYFFENDVNHNPENNAKIGEMQTRADTGRMQNTANNSDISSKNETGADTGRINNETDKESARNTEFGAELGRMQNNETQDDTNAKNENRADTGRINEPQKEQENRETSPETLKENKEEETHIKEENIKEESSSDFSPNQASPKQMIMPGFNDFSMKPPRERIAVKDKKLVGIIDEDKKKWKHDFPYLDTDAILADAEAYLARHPKKYDDIYRFINNSFKRQPYPFPKTSDDVLLFAKERNLSLAREAAEYFFNKYQSIGWRDNNNKPIHDWRCLLENFVATWNQNHYGPQTSNFSQSTYGRPTESKPFDPSKYEN